MTLKSRSLVKHEVLRRFVYQVLMPDFFSFFYLICACIGTCPTRQKYQTTYTFVFVVAKPTSPTLHFALRLAHLLSLVQTRALALDQRPSPSTCKVRCPHFLRFSNNFFLVRCDVFRACFSIVIVEWSFKRMRGACSKWEER